MPVIRGSSPAPLTALRIAGEFELRAILAGVAEGYLVRDPIRAAGVPVFAGPVMERVRSPETMNATYENAHFLVESGITTALRTGNEPPPIWDLEKLGEILSELRRVYCGAVGV